MMYLLQAFGYAAYAAEDGESGLEAAAELRPDLIICDIHLPGMDGFGVVQSLKADPNLQMTPVLAVTALAMVGDRDRVLAGGFDGYISKPIDPTTFAGLVERHLRPPAIC